MGILIIHPDGSEGTIIKTLLEENGHDCHELVTDPAVAQELLSGGSRARDRARSYDLIIMGKPDQPEVERLFREVSGNPELHHVPLLSVVNPNSPASARNSLMCGATDLVGSPIDKFELIARTRTLLRLKREVDRRQVRENELFEANRYISELKKAVNRFSYIDEQTGIGNKLLLDERLDFEWRRAVRNQKPLSLIVFDVDDFPAFRDGYGERAATKALRTVAAEIDSVFRRPGDVVCHYESGRFIAIACETDASGAVQVAETARRRVEDLALVNETASDNGSVTVRAGISTIMPDFSVDQEHFLRTSLEQTAASQTEANTVVCRNVGGARLSKAG